MLLSLFNENSIETIYIISNFWHIPRLKYDAKKILEEYNLEFILVRDPRCRKEIEAAKRQEKIKSISDRMFLKLGYGKKFNKKFIEITSLNYPVYDIPDYLLYEYIQKFTPRYQKMLMKLEQTLHAVNRLV